MSALNRFLNDGFRRFLPRQLYAFGAKLVKRRLSPSDPHSLALRESPRVLLDALNGPGRMDASSKWAVLNSAGLIKAFEQLFKNRDPLIYELFAAARGRDVNSMFVYWLKCRDVEWSGRALAEGELDQLVHYAERSGNDPVTNRPLVNYMLLLLIRMGEHERAEKLLESRLVDLDALLVNQRISLLRWLQSDAGRQLRVKLAPAELYQGLSEFHLLKLRMLTASKAKFQQAPWDHSSIEQEFRRCASRALQAEYDKLLLPCYQRLRARLLYMDVRWNDSQSAELIARVRQALVGRAPFSLIRLSDREGYVFSRDARFFTLEDTRNCERHWWSEEIPESLREEIISDIQEAVRNADILGIPCIYRFLQYQNDKSLTLLGGLNSRGLVEVLNGIPGLAKPSALFSEEKCNDPLFNSFACIRSLAEHAPRVVIVSSAASHALDKLFHEMGEVQYISVPTHSRTRANEKYVSFERPLPFVYKEVRRQIRAAVRPGDLVLVAAGVIGKIFLNDARETGGIALDVGSSLEKWVGAWSGSAP
jgi:hypothetical protein